MLPLSECCLSWNNTACDPADGLLSVRWTSVLVIFQLQWQNTMTKTTNKRKHVIWDSRLQTLEFMIVMLRHNTAGKQTWYWARTKDLHLDPQVQKRKSYLGMLSAFEASKPVPQWYTSFNKAVPSSPSQIFHQLGNKHSNIQDNGNHSHSNHNNFFPPYIFIAWEHITYQRLIFQGLPTSACLLVAYWKTSTEQLLSN